MFLCLIADRQEQFLSFKMSAVSNKNLHENL